MSFLVRKFHGLHHLSRSVAYKSAISLESLYPQSSLKLTTPSKSVSDAKGDFNGYIPVDQLEITYSRSSGPGGQNVNRVNTKVDLRFHLETANWLSNDIKSKLVEKLKSNITKEGYVIFKSDLTRSQQLNLADCLEKLRSTIRQSCKPPPVASEETLEKIRKRHEKAARERLFLKRAHSQTKENRQAPGVRDIL